MLTHLEGHPAGERLRARLLRQRDDGAGLPDETELPEWKVMSLKRIVEAEPTSSAAAVARRMLGPARAARWRKPYRAPDDDGVRGRMRHPNRHRGR